MIKHTVDHPVHPLGSQSRVLLASVFGPYAQDDQYGSRVINPMELYHNQVTRVQHAFSFRSFFRSWGLMLIQVNLKAPCTLLDFPSQERFIEEIKTRTIRCHRDQFDHSESAQGAEDVSADPEASAGRDHCRWRTCRQCAGFEEVGRRGPRRQGRRCAMDARVSRRGREPADPASADHFRRFSAHHGCAASTDTPASTMPC